MSGAAGSRGALTAFPSSPVMACRTSTASTTAPGAVSTTTRRGSTTAAAASDGSAVTAKAITLTKKKRCLIPRCRRNPGVRSMQMPARDLHDASGGGRVGSARRRQPSLAHQKSLARAYDRSSNAMACRAPIDFEGAALRRGTPSRGGGAACRDRPLIVDGGEDGGADVRPDLAVVPDGREDVDGSRRCRRHDRYGPACSVGFTADPRNPFSPTDCRGAWTAPTTTAMGSSIMPTRTAPPSATTMNRRSRFVPRQKRGISSACATATTIRTRALGTMAASNICDVIR